MITKVSKKPFKKADILIYAVLVLLTASLFAVPFCKKNDMPSGFIVSLNGKIVMTSDFDAKNVSVIDAQAVTKISDEVYKIISEKGYNSIKIDWDAHNVTVTGTDCGTSKECTLMSLKGGEIICVPHSLVIKPTGFTPDPTVG